MSARVLREGADGVYQAAQAWVDAARRGDSSLFTPGAPIWSIRWLRELRERLLDQPDESKMKFLEKLQGQLDDSPPEVHRLMAEALYLHLLIVSTRNGNNKRRTIDTAMGRKPVIKPTATVVGELNAELARARGATLAHSSFDLP